MVMVRAYNNLNYPAAKLNKKNETTKHFVLNYTLFFNNPILILTKTKKTLSLTSIFNKITAIDEVA